MFSAEAVTCVAETRVGRQGSTKRVTTQCPDVAAGCPPLRLDGMIVVRARQDSVAAPDPGETNMIKELSAEFIGTFTLVTAVCGAALFSAPNGGGLVAVAFAVGLSVL